MFNKCIDSLQLQFKNMKADLTVNGFIFYTFWDEYEKLDISYCLLSDFITINHIIGNSKIHLYINNLQLFYDLVAKYK